MKQQAIINEIIKTIVKENKKLYDKNGKLQHNMET